jgi:hypothetical protein
MFDKINKTKVRANGRKIFQHKRINWSILYRGNDALTQIKKNNIKPVLKPKTKGSNTNKNETGKDNHPPKKSKTVKKLIKIIEQYSAKKNRAKPILAYSTLNPETNSDSASGKSKGALFVSANIEIRNIKNNGKKGIAKKTKL